MPNIYNNKKNKKNKITWLVVFKVSQLQQAENGVGRPPDIAERGVWGRRSRGFQGGGGKGLTRKRETTSPRPSSGSPHAAPLPSGSRVKSNINKTILLQRN